MSVFSTASVCEFIDHGNIDADICAASVSWWTAQNAAVKRELCQIHCQPLEPFREPPDKGVPSSLHLHWLPGSPDIVKHNCFINTRSLCWGVKGK